MDWAKRKMIKLFTLIELIVVIVVIGILAAIVVPNITSMKEEATITAINGNMRNLQTAIDAFQIKNNGTLPSVEEAAIGNPQPLDLSQLNPEYVRNLPKIKGLKHWVDYMGTLWLSKADAPTNVMYSDGELTWSPSSNSEGYNVFAAEKNEASSNASRKDITLIKGIKGGNINSLGNLPALEVNQTYYISAIDENGFETPPVGSKYTGYKNQRPVAAIGFKNVGSILDSQPIQWELEGIVDPDNDKIIAQEWKVNNQEVTASPPDNPFPAGTHTVQLRVKDEYGLWSDWVSEEIIVEVFNRKPVAIIEMNPTENLTTQTNISWNYNSSTDPDGDSIIESEWKVNDGIVSQPPSLFTLGNHRVELRVKDSKGGWSDWKLLSFNIEIDELLNLGYNSTTFLNVEDAYSQYVRSTLSNATTARTQLRSAYPSYNIGNVVKDSDGTYSAVGYLSNDNSTTYKYDKYNVDTEHTYQNSTGSWEHSQLSSQYVYNSYGYTPEGIIVNTSSGGQTLYSGTRGTGNAKGYTQINANTIYEYSNDSRLYYTDSYGSQRYIEQNGNGIYRRTLSRSIVNTTYSKGTQLSSIYSSVASLPVDGRYSDGYWYTRKNVLPNYKVFVFSSDLKLLSTYDTNTNTLTSEKLNLTSSSSKITVNLAVNKLGGNYQFQLSSNRTSWSTISQSSLTGNNLIAVPNDSGQFYWRVILTKNGTTLPQVGHITINER